MEGSSRPRLDAGLLCFTTLWLCTELVLATNSGPQTGKICCSVTPSGEPPKSCGKCGDGKCCMDKKCHQCRVLPTCPEGQERRCSGTIEFRYFCRSCPNGTYSDPKSDCCIPWTDCKILGLPILQPGNSTHDVKCRRELITMVMQPDSMATTILTTVTAAGLSVLILMTFFLLICVWTQKKEKFPLVKDQESINPSNLLASQGLHHEDTYSCRFPEEERGDKMAEEKVSLSSAETLPCSWS
ncbi:tumor necrosis factor receptor superfamily member 18 [Rhineura floridana]|uniref:tumor necrosis factor receptor superfamily member 18 n=1 Tax=Rhineura floridana TaxID=261503 RepID=UPI002AC83724|nr:tumor necrosis factor receptor superfamily member 18 [Rhineura floridana]